MVNSQLESEMIRKYMRRHGDMGYAPQRPGGVQDAGMGNHFLGGPAHRPPPDLPNGRPAWNQGNGSMMDQGPFAQRPNLGLAEINRMSADDGGRRRALQAIYEFMNQNGKMLTPAQKLMVQAKAREIRNAFYANRQRNQVHGNIHNMDTTAQVPFDPSGYNPTPR
jgi:hypothetical protein